MLGRGEGKRRRGGATRGTDPSIPTMIKSEDPETRRNVLEKFQLYGYQGHQDLISVIPGSAEELKARNKSSNDEEALLANDTSWLSHDGVHPTSAAGA